MEEEKDPSFWKQFNWRSFFITFVFLFFFYTDPGNTSSSWKLEAILPYRSIIEAICFGTYHSNCCKDIDGAQGMEEKKSATALSIHTYLYLMNLHFQDLIPEDFNNNSRVW